MEAAIGARRGRRAGGLRAGSGPARRPGRDRAGCAARRRSRRARRARRRCRPRPTGWRRRAAQRGYRVESRDALADLDLVLLTLRLPPGTPPAAAIRELEALEPGATVGLNHAYAADPGAGAGRARVYADTLLDWPEGGCPARLAVGIIDTGLDPGAPGLQRRDDHQPRLRRNRRRDHARHGGGGAAGGPGRLQGARLYHAAVVGRRAGRRPRRRRRRHHARGGVAAGSGVRLVNVEPGRPLQQDPRPRAAGRRATAAW